MTGGIEVHDEATEVLILAVSADDGDRAAVEVSGAEGIGTGGGVARLKGAGVAVNRAGTPCDDDVNMTQLGGEQLLVLDLLELGGHDDFIATGGDEGIDGRLQVGGEGIDVISAWGNDYGACRAGDGDETGRGDAGKVRWGHAEDADFFTTALDDGGLGEFGVGGRGADAGVVLVRVRGEGAGVTDVAGEPWG